MGILQSLIGFLGRALFSLIFIASGLHKVLNWDASQQYLIQGLNECLGMSVGHAWLQEWIEIALQNASSLLTAAAACELIGGLMIFLGVSVRFGALILFVFLVPTTAVFHHFWMLQGAERELQSIMFLKNTSILGGLLFLFAYGSGGCKAGKSESSGIA